MRPAAPTEHEGYTPPQESTLKPPPSLLTCVSVVVRQRPEESLRRGPSAGEQVGSLPHAVATISAFLDYGREPFWNIPNTCEHNHMLLPRLASRESGDMNAYYRAYLCRSG